MGQLGHQPQYNAAMLAEAMCKLEGFTYAPSETLLAARHSTERDFIYVTTQTLTAEQLQKLTDEVGRTARCWSAAVPSAPRTWTPSPT